MSVTTEARLLGRLLLLPLAIGLVASPALANEPDKGSPADVLRARAGEYWQAKVDRSKAVYGFYRPTEKGGPVMKREVTEFEQMRVTAFEILGVEVEGDKASVRVRVTRSLADLGLREPVSPDLLTREKKESWERFEGAWYKVAVPRRKSKSAASPTPPVAVQEGAIEKD